MTNSDDPDPYAELDYRSDASELADEFRKPVKIRHKRPAGLTRRIQPSFR